MTGYEFCSTYWWILPLVMSVVRKNFISPSSAAFVVYPYWGFVHISPNSATAHSEGWDLELMW